MKKKFFITTTIPETFVFFKGNLAFLNEVFDICAISSQKDKLEKVGEDEGVRTHYIPMSRPVSLLNDISCLFRFLWFFIKEKPDIVHGNTPKASFLSMIASKITSVKIRIYMCHGLRYQGTSGIMKWLLMRMEKLTCTCANEVICVSKGVRDTLIVDGICPPEKAVVIHHGSAGGIDMKRFELNIESNRDIKKELGIGPSDFVYIYVGRIVQDKGINELVSAFVKLQASKESLHLILIGPEEADLNPISEQTRNQIYTSKNIHALGRQNDIRSFMMCSDAFVLPSYREGFGMVLIEAGALGLPCISTDISGCNEIIVSGENGEIIPPRDENALYEKMKEWVEQPEKLAAMASKARGMVESRFEQSMVWNALLLEYKRLLDRAGNNVK